MLDDTINDNRKKLIVENKTEHVTYKMIRAGVFGATGTTGVELANLLQQHPCAQLVFGTSRELAGTHLTETDPAAPELMLIHPDEAFKQAVDVAFLCLPHGAAAAMAADLCQRGMRTIDLSGDLRLRDPEVHQKTYGTTRSEHIAQQAVYGLPEIFRSKVRDSLIVTNPGCYPTAVGLGLLPLAEHGYLKGFVYIDAKSGVSGAGRAPTATTHYCSANEDIRPYKFGRSHRHVPEMEQTINFFSDNSDCKVIFCPHLVPLERGILASCLVQGSGLTAEEAHRLYCERYASEPFVKVLPVGEGARIRAAAHSNRVVIGVADVPECDVLLITSSIDNLGKGAAGQAVQNMNIMFDLPETLGLRGV